MTSARLAAARTLVALERGRSTLAADAERERPDLADSRDRGLFLEIVTGAVRWRAELDACLAACSRRTIKDLTPEVRAVLRTAAYQLLHLDRVPAHAAVSEAVETMRALGQPRAAGFVNAVLRKLTLPTVRTVLPARPQDAGDRGAALQYLSTTLSHPRWLIERWLDRFGFEATERWCLFNNEPPTLTVRWISPSNASLGHALQEAGLDAAPSRFIPNAYCLAPGVLGRLPADLKNAVLVQDEGSQIVAHSVGAQPGQRVFDVCAAPGGKALILAEAVGESGIVIAADLRPARVALLQAQIRRSGRPVPIVRVDATGPLPFGETFDRVLLDAPCSGLGTLRRDPDLKWTRTEADLAPLVHAQLAMIGRAATVVRPGGALIYATCSSEPEENEGVVNTFLDGAGEFEWASLAGNAEASLLTARGSLQTLPHRDALDAFFAAKLVRTSAA